MAQHPPQVTSDCPPRIDSSSPLPNGTVGTDYSFTFQATGGMPRYRWNISSEMRPPGIALSADGVLSGRPTTSGTFKFTMKVEDHHEGTAVLYE